MSEVDQRLIFDDAASNKIEQRQQWQTEMIEAEFTQPPHHYVQVPHS